MSTPEPVQQLTHTTLRVQARRALRGSIISGEIEAGRLYSVGEFAERLGVSATPVREALGDLEQRGLIKVVRNRGFIVPPLTEHDLDEIFQIRIILEVAAVAEITGKLRATDAERCDIFVERALESAEKGDIVGFLEADRDFHLTLIGLLDNKRLVETVDGLRDQTRLYGLAELAAGGQLKASALEHRELLDAISSNDKVRATDTLRRHLVHTRGLWAGREELDPATG